MSKPLVGIIMGSQSDLALMSGAADILESFGIAYEITVCSAHRSPELAAKYASTAQKRGLKVIIAGAGGAAHLAGVAASLTTLPVIGVPVRSPNSLEGFDSLLSTVQMPEGIPVATVAVNGAKNAGILAVQIIATGNAALSNKVKAYKVSLSKKVEAIQKEIAVKGFRAMIAAKR